MPFVNRDLPKSRDFFVNCISSPPKTENGGEKNRVSARRGTIQSVAPLYASAARRGTIQSVAPLSVSAASPTVQALRIIFCGAKRDNAARRKRSQSPTAYRISYRRRKHFPAARAQDRTAAADFSPPTVFFAEVRSYAAARRAALRQVKTRADSNGRALPRYLVYISELSVSAIFPNAMRFSGVCGVSSRL